MTDAKCLENVDDETKFWIPSPWVDDKGDLIDGANGDFIIGWRAFQEWLRIEKPEIWKQLL
jgi:hypothetical protein